MEENFNKNETAEKKEQASPERQNESVTPEAGQPKGEKRHFKTSVAILSAVAVFAIGLVGGIVGSAAAADSAQRRPERMTVFADSGHGQGRNSQRLFDEERRQPQGGEEDTHGTEDAEQDDNAKAAPYRDAGRCERSCRNTQNKDEQQQDGQQERERKEAPEDQGKNGDNEQQKRPDSKKGSTHIRQIPEINNSEKA